MKMGLFEKGFNKFAEVGTTLNKGVNKALGKEVFGEIRKIEAPKEFPHTIVTPNIPFRRLRHGLLKQARVRFFTWREVKL